MSDAKQIIGNIDCPVCGHEMPVKADKNGHAYGHCAHRCNAQVFTRNDHRDGLLRKAMRPVTVSVPLPEPTPAVPKPSHAVGAAPVPPLPTGTPPVQQPAGAKTKANWFSPVLGGAKHGRA
ncbi:hypothetical protein [Massilia luteola]|uniref:hypothetical protein n=1 Tax=Massilia luteola TaxID=3081751 RepID=UPI002ACBFA6B|nr:hypothetical protein [Massilia sp. Gc5]